MITGPWYISVRAVQDYLRLSGRPGVEDGPEFDRAAKELSAMLMNGIDAGPRQRAESRRP